MAGRLKKLSPEQAHEAVVGYAQGLSLGALAKTYDVSRQAMWDLLRRRTALRPQKRVGADNHFYRGGPKSDPRAHDKLEKALLRGNLVNPRSCEQCGAGGTFSDGRSAVHGHHDDYNKPLSVRWLCQSCHHEWHRNNTPILRRDSQ